MAYFPDQVMPKQLKRETSREVDDSPSIYNARDYNIHHREIRAIQQFLIGSASTGSGVQSLIDSRTSGKTDDSVSGGGLGDGGSSLTDLVLRIAEVMDMMTNRGLVGQYSGTIQSGGQVRLPPDVSATQTVGGVGSTSDVIGVTSTTGFPSRGIITKFNGIGVGEVCSDGNPPGGGARCDVDTRKVVTYNNLISGSHATNQEIISYASKTDTSFQGCVRSVNGSTSQDATSDAPAIIVNGRAAMSFGHNFWGRASAASSNQFYLYHDALLRATASLRGLGSRQSLGSELQDHIEISWMLTIVGYFEDIDVRQLFDVIG